MKGGRKSYAEQTRAKLLELWSGQESFGRPLGCVATTFTFDAELFEEQCLARFLSIQSNPNETAKAYLVEREEKLSQCFACVLVDRAHTAADRSLRWHLLPVTLPRGGVLHAKLTLLVWEKCIRVMIGSANLTEPGFRRNQEVMAVHDYTETDNPPKEVLVQSLEFLAAVRGYSPGSDRLNIGPQAALETFLRSVERRASSLSTADRDSSDCTLVPLLPGGTSVVDQLGRLWKGPAPDQAWVLSPFYDEEGKASHTAASFAGLLTTKGARSLVITAPGRKLPDGKMQIDAPSDLIKSSHRSLSHSFSVIFERYTVEEKEIDRPLHAKSIWLQREKRALYMLGSSNFTAAGLGLHPGHNIELNLAYVLRDCTAPFARLCAQSWPPEEDVPDPNDAQFLADGQTDSAENPDAPILPSAFGLALYWLDDKGARLELEISENAPLGFEVLSKDGTLLIDGKEWRKDGAQKRLSVTWGARRPPSGLEVRWRDARVGDCVGQWIVNIGDMSSLPPPDELGSLTLDELMEILTSARPLHEVVSRILERRKKKAEKGGAVEVDPHKKVDTSQFLLRRMRRVALALEGMHARLKQPVGSMEALRWRLRGPIGPLALAARLTDADPHGAAFMISEVASTLCAVSWQPWGTLDHREVNSEVAQVVTALHALASAASAPSNLKKYVKRSFEEMLR